jgi:hypothetical protein
MTTNEPRRRRLSWISAAMLIALVWPAAFAHDYPSEVRIYMRSGLLGAIIGLQIYMTVLWHRDRAERARR